MSIENEEDGKAVVSAGTDCSLVVDILWNLYQIGKQLSPLQQDLGHKYKCVTCNGSGEVHNHNPKCWDCNGTGETDRQTAESAIRSQIIPEMTIVKWLARKPFDKDEQDSEVARLLELL